MKVCLKTDEFPSLILLPTTPAVALLLIVVTAKVDIAEVTICFFVLNFCL